MTTTAIHHARLAATLVPVDVASNRQLRSAGMSTRFGIRAKLCAGPNGERSSPCRAIGSALGVGDATVRRDLPGASNDAPAEPITGLDGKTYQRKGGLLQQARGYWSEVMFQAMLNGEEQPEPAKNFSRMFGLAERGDA